MRASHSLYLSYTANASTSMNGIQKQGIQKTETDIDNDSRGQLLFHVKQDQPVSYEVK